MSEFAIGPESTTIYALNDGRPADTWSSEWTLLDDARLVGSDIPEGFHQVPYEEFIAAQRAQAITNSQRLATQARDQRLILSNQRRQLVMTGMSVEQVRILVPDPDNDYSIDDSW
jgi:hypothetical protein